MAYIDVRTIPDGSQVITLPDFYDVPVGFYTLSRDHKMVIATFRDSNGESSDKGKDSVVNKMSFGHSKQPEAKIERKDNRLILTLPKEYSVNPEHLNTVQGTNLVRIIPFEEYVDFGKRLDTMPFLHLELFQY